MELSLTLRILPITSPVAGHFDTISSPEPFHWPSYTPDSGVSGPGRFSAESTLVARDERYRRDPPRGMGRAVKERVERSMATVGGREDRGSMNRWSCQVWEDDASCL
jgi:hypothetical protein